MSTPTPETRLRRFRLAVPRSSVGTLAKAAGPVAPAATARTSGLLPASGGEGRPGAPGGELIEEASRRPAAWTSARAGAAGMHPS